MMSLDDALNILSPDYPLTDAEDAGTPIYDEVFAPLLEARAAEAEAEAKRQAATYEAIHLCKAADRELDAETRAKYIADATKLDPAVVAAWLAEQKAAEEREARDAQMQEEAERDAEEQAEQAAEDTTTSEGNES